MLNFGMLLMPTMYRSYSNYQMTSGCLWGSMNLHMNQCWADISARQNLYNVPILNFANFSQYGVFSSMNYLLDPGYTAGQYMSLQMTSQGGLAGMQMPTMPTNTGGPSGLSEEDKVAKKQYEKLKLLLDTCLKKAGRGIRDDDKEFVQEALKKSGKWSEKLDALKEAYKKFDENVIKKSMTQLQSTDKKIDYTTLLKDIGYNFDNGNSYKTNCNDEFKEIIQSIMNDDDYEELNELIETLKTENNILNLISTWNDTYSDIGETRNILEYILEKSQEEGNTLDGNIVPDLADALIEKAKEIASDCRLSTETKAYIKDLYTTLDMKKNDLYGPGATETNTSFLLEKFNNLYMALRLAEIKMAQEDMQTEYGFIADISSNDNDFIKDQNLLIEETMQDLKDNEGFQESELTDHAAKIKLTA